MFGKEIHSICYDKPNKDRISFERVNSNEVISLQA